MGIRLLGRWVQEVRRFIDGQTAWCSVVAYFKPHFGWILSLKSFYEKTSQFQGFPAHSIQSCQPSDTNALKGTIGSFPCIRFSSALLANVPAAFSNLCSTERRWVPSVSWITCTADSTEMWQTKEIPKKIRKTGNRLRSERKDWWTKKWMWKNNKKHVKQYRFDSFSFN